MYLRVTAQGLCEATSTGLCRPADTAWWWPCTWSANHHSAVSAGSDEQRTVEDYPKFLTTLSRIATAH